ncbi:MAG: hypothetical protein HYT70_02710 [Candidatus Aenigmarchaeota archaeon]|nr:hypothetical protein [Candidatus Aenigmarchaeota archaeon]
MRLGEAMKIDVGNIVYLTNVYFDTMKRAIVGVELPKVFTKGKAYEIERISELGTRPPIFHFYLTDDRGEQRMMHYRWLKTRA